MHAIVFHGTGRLSLSILHYYAYVAQCMAYLVPVDRSKLNNAGAKNLFDILYSLIENVLSNVCASHHPCTCYNMK